MSTQFLKIALVAIISLGAVSCNDKVKDAEVSDAKEVAESTSAATTYMINAETSVINWKGSKPAGEHTGTIKLSSGSFDVVNRDIQSGKFVIDMTSLSNTDLKPGEGKENLEAHLKGTAEGKENDFFSVANHPTATFELTGVTGEGGNVTVSGNLTMKGKTHNVEFPAVVSFPGDDIMFQSKPFTIDRTNWDINFMSKSVFDNLKDKFIDDEIELKVILNGKKA